MLVYGQEKAKAIEDRRRNLIECRQFLQSCDFIKVPVWLWFSSNFKRRLFLAIELHRTTFLSGQHSVAES